MKLGPQRSPRAAPSLKVLPEKKIHPPIQADNMELLSYGETKLLYSEFHWQSHVYTIILFVSMKQTQTSKISINLYMHEKKKTGRIQALPNQ